jgi:PhoPQ-activated pathogenicity-related protein
MKTKSARLSRSRVSVPRIRWFHPHVERLEERALLSIAPSTVVGRFLFYDQSRYDGNVAGVNASDAGALATDKTALIGGSGTATFDNVSGYSRGINGLFVDISGSHPNITSNDFSFTVGNNNSPSTWTPAPAPTDVTVRAGAGVSGSDRVEFVWADSAIWRKWLRVSVAADVNTGLAQSDVFYFGSSPADTGLGDSASFFSVDGNDELGVRGNYHQIFQNIPISTPYDFDRNGDVSAVDELYARNHYTTVLTAPRKLSPPAATPPSLSAQLANDTGPDAQPNSDAITTDPTISGHVTFSNPLTSLRAGLNGNPVSFDVLPRVQPDGSFTLDAATLQSINGGTLPDGSYTLHLQAVDSTGLGAAVHVAFVLKHSVTTPAMPDLIAADDLGTSNTDNWTSVTTPRIAVSAETGSLVRLYVDGVAVQQATAAPGLQFTLAALANGSHDIYAISQDGAGNSATSATLTIIVDYKAVTLSLSTLTPFTDDLTPHITVNAGTATGVLNIDVDLNNDGDFSDPGELGRMVIGISQGQAYFQLTPALPPTDPALGPYTVQLRARFSDTPGNTATSPLSPLEIDTIGSTALADYVAAADPSYHYSVANTVVNTGYTYYAIDMTSQTWRTTADVNMPVWRHWVDVVVPTGAISKTALLYITGGNNSVGAPPSSADPSLVNIALTTHAVVVVIHTVPSEPLTFTGESQGRSEDAIIAYTFNQYMTHLGDPDNETWPVLVAMVKSAVRAMDTAQNFVPTVAGGSTIDNFVVTGYSKRGWTTWLTAAVDPRVKAIIPGVIDVLNMDEQMIHHYGFYGFFSPALNDYVAFNIPQETLTPEERELGRIIDPYRYLNNGRFTIPKLIINSSGDEFFVPDSSQFYFSDLPGTQNYLRYIPNTGHGLDSNASTSTLTFFDAILNNRTLPQYSWNVLADGTIRLQTTTTPTNVVMWQATNPNARDFRHAYNPSIVYTSSTLNPIGGGVYLANVPMPATGATAYFIQMTYPSGIAGQPYVFTTEIHVKSNIPLVAWPFYMPPAGGAMAMTMASDSSDATGEGSDVVASGLAISAQAKADEPDPVVQAFVAPAASTAVQALDTAQSQTWMWPLDSGDPLATDEPASAGTNDLALGELLSEDSLL